MGQGNRRSKQGEALSFEAGTEFRPDVKSATDLARAAVVKGDVEWQEFSPHCQFSGPDRYGRIACETLFNDIRCKEWPMIRPKFSGLDPNNKSFAVGSYCPRLQESATGILNSPMPGEYVEIRSKTV